jgi:protocatechuate 3,4-dioxygenase, beta subunit
MVTQESGMARIITPRLGRRSLIIGAAATAGAGVLALPRMLEAQPKVNAVGMVVTPRQTEGPFYPLAWDGDVDNDLVVVTGEAARAQGIVTHIRGRVLGADGAPVAGAKIEIWQCDARGHYRHPGDVTADPLDAGFQGHGRMASAADGAYRFRTIKPVAYPGRTPHIHFAVTPPNGRPLITQMYVAGDPLNAQDGILMDIRDPRQRAAVLVELEAADRLEQGALVGSFDIVLA